MITQNTLFGRSRKSVGGVTSTTYKGLNVVRSKPMTVSNPKTEAQVAVRETMKRLVKQFRLFPDAIKKAFSQAPAPLSEYNQFVRENYAAFKARVDSGVGLLDRNLFVASKGSLTKLRDIVFTWTNAGQAIDYAFNNTPINDQHSTDKPYLMVVSETLGIVTVLPSAFNLSVGGAQWELDELNLPNGNYRAYLFLYSPSTNKVSDATYHDFVKA